MREDTGSSFILIHKYKNMTQTLFKEYAEDACASFILIHKYKMTHEQICMN